MDVKRKYGLTTILFSVIVILLCIAAYTINLNNTSVLDDINKMGTTIIMTTHNRDIVNAMKKRVVVIHEGKIVKDYERGKYYEVL